MNNESTKVQNPWHTCDMASDGVMTACDYSEVQQ